MSSSSPVRIVSGAMYANSKIMILCGSDVFLRPHGFEGELDGLAGWNPSRLRDCEGKEFKVAGVRTVSVIVDEIDGSQAELTQFVSQSVKSCILRLDMLYRTRWCIKQNTDGPTWNLPDRTKKEPTLSERPTPTAKLAQSPSQTTLYYTACRDPVPVLLSTSKLAEPVPALLYTTKLHRERPRATLYHKALAQSSSLLKTPERMPERAR